MAFRRRDRSGEDGPRPTYSGLGGRVEQVLRLAEEQRDQIITEARREADEIVDYARKQTEGILTSARAQAPAPYWRGAGGLA